MLGSLTCTCAQLSPTFTPYFSHLADTWVVGDGLHIGQALNGLDARLYKRRALRIESEAVHKCLSAAAPITPTVNREQASARQNGIKYQRKSSKG